MNLEALIICAKRGLLISEPVLLFCFGFSLWTPRYRVAWIVFPCALINIPGPNRNIYIYNMKRGFAGQVPLDKNLTSSHLKKKMCYCICLVDYQLEPSPNPCVEKPQLSYREAMALAKQQLWAIVVALARGNQRTRRHGNPRACLSRLLACC
jgi:hypothetical protein